ncbi:uncharacterized protein LOC121382935 [Gigantopelta aegis]|uniref:uncharacterized protein LOC121382935 n=1 Tax=Gigantopelta aegis TaxID=1735272 RepID=UPI001B88D729|nr:uncharacterized protein LOC121382935 [Gigantopelta aegis]
MASAAKSVKLSDTKESKDEPSNMFSAPSATSDVVLLVEYKPIHVNKAILSLASPVSAAMFEDNFKEKHAAEIPLPDKKYKDFIEFLLCLYPNTAKPVDQYNINIVLPLADEYQVENLKRRSEAMILVLFKIKRKHISTSELVNFLFLSDKYAFKHALSEVINLAGERCPTDLFQIADFDRVSSDIKFSILKRYLTSFVDPAKRILREVQSVCDCAEGALLGTIKRREACIHTRRRCQHCEQCDLCLSHVERSLKPVLEFYKCSKSNLAELLK